MYIYIMKKIQKDLSLKLVRCSDNGRKYILDSMIASFRIEGISIPEKRVQAVFSRVNERLKKQMQ